MKGTEMLTKTVVWKRAEHLSWDGDVYQRQFSSLIADPAVRHLILDFALEEQMSASLLGAIASACASMRKRGGRVKVCGLSQLCEETLRVTRIDTLGNCMIYATIRDAWRSCEPQ